MTTLSPLTPADFESRDGHHVFSLYEDQDSRIFGYGHPDRAIAAQEVREYYQRVAGEAVRVRPYDVAHVWAVRIEDDSDGEPRFIYRRGGDPIGPEEPGAFPIWTVSL